MDSVRFVLIGQDKVALSHIKNALVSDGHTFIGYSSNHSGLLKIVRTLQPELTVIEYPGSFRELKQTLEIIDEELLSPCILLMDIRKEEIMEFLNSSRILSYITKPVHEDVLLQIADMLLTNFKRVMQYEDKVRQLNNTLENRKILEKAKWILVEQDRVSEAEAYDMIRKRSRDNRITMRATAEAIILARGEATHRKNEV
jgi:two-component system, response regulator PdtaR